MTALTISSTRSTLRARPRGLDGAIYRLGMAMAAWARTHSARQSSDRRMIDRQRQWREAADSYAAFRSQGDVFEHWASR